MYLIDFEQYYSYDEIVNSCIKLKNLYHPLVSLKSIGISHDNREILLLSIGSGNKRIICTGGVHARETVNPIVLLKILEEYAKSYFGYKWIGGMNIRALLNEYSIIFVPLLNPDGYMIALNGYDCIRNLHLRHRCMEKELSHHNWKYNGRAIDLNRNFPSKSFVPTEEMPDSLSENEAAALAEVFRQYESLAYIDFHSRGESIFYYRGLMDRDYNDNQFRIGKALQKATGYLLEKPDDEIPANDSGGNTVHYYSEVFHKPAITIETVKEEEGFPLPPGLGKEVFRQIYAVPAVMLTVIQ